MPSTDARSMPSAALVVDHFITGGNEIIVRRQTGGDYTIGMPGVRGSATRAQLADLRELHAALGREIARRDGSAESLALQR